MNTNTTATATTTTVDTAAIKTHLATYEDLNADIASYEEAIAKSLAERTELVRALALIAPKSFTYKNRTVSIVLDGGRSGTSTYLRGLSEPKVSTKEVLDLDA
jgi:hypothetical protein